MYSAFNAIAVLKGVFYGPPYQKLLKDRVTVEKHIWHHLSHQSQEIILCFNEQRLSAVAGLICTLEKMVVELRCDDLLARFGKKHQIGYWSVVLKKLVIQ